MKKIYLKEHLKGVKDYPIEVVKSILRSIELLDDNYGVNRNIEADLGGYVFIAENIVEVEMLKQDKLKGIVSEYTDIIKCSEGVNWISSLFLLSSDYSIVVVNTEELSKYLLE